MKIIHFSDSHAGGPAEDWMAYIDKRWVGVFNYKFRRKFKHDQSLLSAAVDYILDVKPDVAVCTGDLTSTGQPGEFRISLDILKPLTDSNIPLIYLPGNHDCYVKSKKCVNAMKDAFATLNKNLFSFDSLPASTIISGVEFLVINESYPTNLLSSCGYLKKKEKAFIISKCAEEKKYPRILVGHYPLYEKNAFLRVRHRLWGQKKVLELLRSGKIDISLCGHVHYPYCGLDSEGRGEICAGSVTRNSCMAEIKYNGDDNSFSYKKIDLGVILRKKGTK